MRGPRIATASTSTQPTMDRAAAPEGKPLLKFCLWISLAVEKNKHFTTLVRSQPADIRLSPTFVRACPLEGFMPSCPEM